MKRLLPALTFILVVFSFSISYSQVSLTLNGGYQLPVGNSGTFLNSGYGVSASVDYSFPFIPVGISLSAGYDNWAYKTFYSSSNSGIHQEGTGINLYSIPIMLGPELLINLPGSSFKPYLGIDAGIVLSSSTLAGAILTSNFIYSPVVGCRYSLPPGIIAIDINVRESNMNDTGSNQTFSWIGINSGISISL